MAARRRRRAGLRGPSAYALEWVAIVVHSLFFLVAVGAALSLVIAHFALGVPLVGSAWSRFALGAIAVVSGVEGVLHVAVRSRRKAEARRGYTTSPDRSLELTGVHPMSGATLRPAGTAPDLQGLDGLVTVPVPKETLAPPMGGIARFEWDPNWPLGFTVVGTLLIAPPIIYLKLSQPSRGGLTWQQLGGILLAVVAVGVAVVATIVLVRSAVRASRRAVAGRSSPTAVVFSVRRTATLDEALGFLGLRLRTRSILAVLTFDRLELWDGSSSVLALPWRTIVHVRPGRVGRGMWPIPRWSRAILVRLDEADRALDLALAPFGDLFRANLLLDEFRHRTRVVPKDQA